MFDQASLSAFLKVSAHIARARPCSQVAFQKMLSSCNLQFLTSVEAVEAGGHLFFRRPAGEGPYYYPWVHGTLAREVGADIMITICFLKRGRDPIIVSECIAHWMTSILGPPPCSRDDSIHWRAVTMTPADPQPIQTRCMKTCSWKGEGWRALVFLGALNASKGGRGRRGDWLAFCSRSCSPYSRSLRRREGP